MIESAATLFKDQTRYFQGFEKKGLPNRKTERWKFTPVASLYQKEWNPQAAISAGELDEFSDFVSFDSLGELSKSKNCEVKKLKPSEIESFFQQFETTKFWQEDDSLFQWHLSQLDHFYHIKYTGEETLSLTHSLGSGALVNYGIVFEITSPKATVLESFLGTRGQTYHQTSRFFDLKENQDIKHVIVNEATPEQSQQIWTFANLDHDKAQYHGLQVNFGGGLVRSNPFINIQKPHSFGEFNGFYFLTGADHFDFYSQIKHFSGETESNQVVKGLLHDQSKFAFTGNIYISKNSQLVNAAQFNKNLVMSNQAQAFGQPQLEIFADDVKCSHGSTTGQFDIDELFYLNARAISPTKAKRLMAQAYGLELIQMVDNDVLNTYLTGKLTSKLKTAYGESR